MRAVTHGNGPPTSTEVRAYRRRFERECVAHAPRPLPQGPARRAWLNWLWAAELERHPELRVPARRPTLPIGGRQLYVLVARVHWILAHPPSGPVARHRHSALVR